MTIYSLDVLLSQFGTSLCSMSSSNCCILTCKKEEDQRYQKGFLEKWGGTLNGLFALSGPKMPHLAYSPDLLPTDYHFKHLDNFLQGKMLPQTAGGRKCFPRVRQIPGMDFYPAVNWLQIGKGVRQGCILSPCLFNLHAEYIMRNAGLEEAQDRKSTRLNSSH